MKNHLGSYECKLCLTLHNNEVRPGPWGGRRAPASWPSRAAASVPRLGSERPEGGGGSGC